MSRFRSHFLFIAALVSLAGLGSRAHAESVEDTWNLNDLYPSVEAWEEAKANLEKRLNEFEGCNGKMVDEASVRRCVKLYFNVAKELWRLQVYSGSAYDSNQKDNSAKERNLGADSLGTKFEQTISFMRPQLAALGLKLRKIVGNAPKADENFFIEDVLRQAKHICSQEGEKIIANKGDIVQGPKNAWDSLCNSDIKWPTVTLSNGKTATLNSSEYSRYRGSANREDRKKVFDAFWGTWNQFESTMGSLLNTHVNSHVASRNDRNYSSSLTAALDNDNIPESVYRTLIEQTNANLPTLHRYLKLRQRMLGLPDLYYYDIYPPIVALKKDLPLEEGKARILKALAPLGPEYIQTMKTAFESRWIDVYPREGKPAGAYNNGAAYDVHPYMLMNYLNNYDSVSTMAHEGGHAMHSSLANHAQPFAKSSYAIFVAEIASTFNERLLFSYSKKTAENDDERLYYLGKALEKIQQTFFRQTSFAEFELAIHTEVEQGRPLTGEKLTKMYGALLKKYYGDGKVMTIDDAYAVEWAFIPHFYRNFYVYQYATSQAASSLFADEVMNGIPGATEKYLNLLKAGGSDYPYNLVKNAGVDLATPAPYQSLIKWMNAIMDEIEGILKTQGK